MNKKEYIKPNSKHIVIAGATLLSGSNGDNTPPGYGGGDGNEGGDAIDVGGKFSLWEDED